jgi:hypothetical protein
MKFRLVLTMRNLVSLPLLMKLAHKSGFMLRPMHGQRFLLTCQLISGSICLVLSYFNVVYTATQRMARLLQAIFLMLPSLHIFLRLLVFQVHMVGVLLLSSGSKFKPPPIKAVCLDWAGVPSIGPLLPRPIIRSHTLPLFHNYQASFWI